MTVPSRHRSVVVNRWMLYLSLPYLVLSSALAQQSPPNLPKEDLDKISEYNRAIWRYRRCVHRYEEQHGPSKDGKPPEVCGEEPKLPK